MGIEFDYSNSFIADHEIEAGLVQLEASHKVLEEGTGPGRDFLGWNKLARDYDREEFKRIKEVAEKIRKDSEILLVIGIGGSYLGARAFIEALGHSFSSSLIGKGDYPQVFYVGNNISSKYILDLFDLIKDRDFSINVISKSGTTTEPALAFRIFKEEIEKRYGKKEAAGRIYVTTDREEGALKVLADKEGYESFVIPDDVGGRFSVFTAVGLLPMSVAGLDIDEIMRGARDGMEDYSNLSFKDNPAYQYALVRNILRNKGNDIELLVHYEPGLSYLAEWWKQLYGESEGKDGKGLFPASVGFTTDLHSMGQLIQDGRKNLFETTINIVEPERDLKIGRDEDNLDGLNYLESKTIDYVNKKAFEGTLKAHVEGGVANLVFNMERLDEYHLAKLAYLFQKSCAISGYMLGVNPFDQPGVEAYKKNMFELLGK